MWCGMWNETQPWTVLLHHRVVAMHGGPALEAIQQRAHAGQIRRRRLGQARADRGELLGDRRRHRVGGLPLGDAAVRILDVEQRRDGAPDRELCVLHAGDTVRRRHLAEHARREREHLGVQPRRLVGVDDARGVLLGRAPRDELLEAKDRLLARREVEQRLPPALDAEQPRHELGQRARDRDQQLRLVGRTQLRAGAIGFEPFSQRRILRGQRSAKTRVERRQRRRIVKIGVAHPLEAEREVTVGARRRAFRRPLQKRRRIPLYSYRRTLQNSW